MDNYNTWGVQNQQIPPQHENSKFEDVKKWTFFILGILRDLTAIYLAIKGS